jgi:chemotaxis protein MotB
MRLLLVFVLLLAAALGGLYFWLYRPQEESLAMSKQELSAKDEEIRHLKSRVADLETVQEELETLGSALKKQVAEKEKEMAALRSTQDELVSELQQEIADQRIEVERIRDKLRVEMVDEVLFDSGEAVIKPDGIRILTKIGGVLKKAGNRAIEIQGHTDNVPIRGALAKRFATNWELSAARAINVVRFLQDSAGLDPKNLVAHAFSEYQPRSTNETAEGRRKNRRIEIILGPKRSERAVEDVSQKSGAADTDSSAPSETTSSTS